MDELAAEVATASREQTEGITQINVAVGQMDKVTQSNAATAEESAAAAEELSAQAETMNQAVSELLHLVGGQNGSATIRPARQAVRAKEFQASAPKTKLPIATNGNGNGNGHAHATMGTARKRQNEIPLDGDFKDF